MKCPKCSSLQVKVLESRSICEDEVIRRRRICTNCENRFTSYERIEQQPITVLKKNGSKELFSEEKMLRGLTRAFDKRNLTMEQIKNIPLKIEKDLRTKGIFEIHSEELGEVILSNISAIDPVAYIRFASVYKQFSSIEEFYNIALKLKQKEVEQN